jgi:GNAT superfamily N-acetyltransferase
MMYRDVTVALEVEAAEREYLQARVENLIRIDGNPFGARVFYNGSWSCFQVEAAPSPMLNRIYGDRLVDPQSILHLLKKSGACSTATPLIGTLSTLEARLSIEGGWLERMRGWTHLQFACPIEGMMLSNHDFIVEEVTPQTICAFADVHASGFHTKPAHRLVNQASFETWTPDDSLKLFVIRERGEVVAGASMYLASNGVAYLGTAATRKDARGRGYHGALITHRLSRALKHGAEMVAATALPNSQSSRNLKRAGLKVSHAQALYRLSSG